MKTIHVNASKSYDILIERGVLERAEYLRSHRA